VAAADSPLNPTQQEALAALRSPDVPRPSFPDDLARRLRDELEQALAPAAEALEERLYVSKYALGAVHGCEARFEAQAAQPFVTNAAIAAGTAAHKAIQYSQHWPAGASAQELVDEAVHWLIQDEDSTGVWFARAGRAEQAEARTVAIDRVTKFLECFPTLRPRWHPVVESSLRVQLAGGRIVLSGRVDLVLGRPDGLRAGKAFIDLKTGMAQPGHVDDLRFYALLELLRLGVPPFRVASYYLDEGRLAPEDVTEAMLQSAAGRVIDGVTKLVELRTGARPPERRPGWGCRRCPLLPACDPGRAFVAECDDRDGLR
jgi:hypothetical protein